MVRDVLVFTPVKRLEAATVEALMGLVWPGALTLLMQRDNPTGVGIADHLHQYQRGRETFLSGTWDAMLVVESDIVPPKDGLMRLAGVMDRKEAGVAYGCYMLRADQDRPVVNVFEAYGPGARNQGESLTVRGLWGEAVAQGVVECSGGGLGFTLIAREVLEAHPFEIPRGETWTWCDHYWTRDVFRAGWRMVADTGVQCGHICPDGTLLRV